jgi:hypothetical protein
LVVGLASGGFKETVWFLKKNRAKNPGDFQKGRFILLYGYPSGVFIQVCSTSGPAPEAMHYFFNLQRNRAGTPTDLRERTREFMYGEINKEPVQEQSSGRKI